MSNRLKQPLPMQDLNTDQGAVFEFNEAPDEDPERGSRLDELLYQSEGGPEPGAHPKRLAEDRELAELNGEAAAPGAAERGLRDSDENERIMRAFSSDMDKNFCDAEFVRRMEECGTFMQDEDEDDAAGVDEQLSVFEKKKRHMHDITSRFSDEHTGLIYKRTVKTGLGPVVPEGAFVIYDYKMFYEEKLEPFDASRLRSRVERQRVGTGELLEGMELALLTMQKGEEADFLVAPELMFGKQGVHPRIPPEATIFMQLELHRFSERGSIEEYYDMTEDERRNMPFARLVKVADDVRRDGNLFFEDHRYAVAAKKYQRAEQLLCGASARCDEDDLQREAKLLRIYLNQACTWLKLDDNQAAIKYCNYALASLDKLAREQQAPADARDKRAKCYYRKGLALTGLKQFEEAAAALHTANELLPNHLTVQRAVRSNNKSKEAAVREEKLLYSRMVPGFKPLAAKELNGGGDARRSQGNGVAPTFLRAPAHQVLTLEMQKLLTEFACNGKARSYSPPVSVIGWTPAEVNELTDFVKSLSLVPVVTNKDVVEIVKN